MNIEKKFNMLSTKEWMQYLQYKLSPEREKELLDKTTSDPFLKEAVDAFNSLENRNIAFTSLSYIHDQVEEITGVSESKITSINIRKGSTPTINKSTILILVGALVLAGLGALIYFLIQNGTFSSSSDSEETNVVETTNTTTDGVDSSTLPLDALPNAMNSTPVADTPATSTTPSGSTVSPTSSVKKKKSSNYQNDNTANGQVDPNITYTSTPSNNGGANNYSKETVQFNKAQDLYNAGKVEDAKAILNNLKSYDNPKKAQSENILKTISNQ